jgi:hypothetical protein
MDDDYIEQSLKRAELITGRTLTPQELSTEFAKVDPIERVSHMERLEADIAQNSSMSLEDAARQVDYINALRSTHKTLQKIGR